MVFGPNDTAKGMALQFWGRVVCDADLAEVASSVSAYLERIAVNEPNDGVSRNLNVALVDIAYQAPGLVNLVEGRRTVVGRADEKVPHRVAST
jgi:hypothetical protein